MSPVAPTLTSCSTRSSPAARFPTPRTTDRRCGCVLRWARLDRARRPGTPRRARRSRPTTSTTGCAPSRPPRPSRPSGSPSALGVPFELHVVVVAHGPNLEARARDARRSVLPVRRDDRSHRRRPGRDRAACDLLRGSGGDGLAAIEPGPTHPILALRRAETEAVCATLGIDPVRDASNGTWPGWRNRVRHELLPLAADIAGRDVAPLLARTADLLRDEHDAARCARGRPRPHRRQGGGRSPPGARAAGAAPVAHRVGLPARRRRDRAGARRGTRRGPGVRAAGRAPGRTFGTAVPHRRAGQVESSPATSRTTPLTGRLNASEAAREVGARHHAAPLHLDPQGQARDLRAPRRLRRQPPARAPAGGDHLDP